MTYMTDERRMIQEAAREFTMKEVLPVANRLDPVEGEIPMALREKLAAMGYFGILIPEDYGGLGLGCFEYCLITEELARGWMSVASLIARGNSLIGMEKMSDEQRRAYVPKIARGEILGAFAMSEPNAGSDIANISCRARRDGDSYVITGNKYWCTFADGADFLIVIARTGEGKRRHEAGPDIAGGNDQRSVEAPAAIDDGDKGRDEHDQHGERREIGERQPGRLATVGGDRIAALRVRREQQAEHAEGEIVGQDDGRERACCDRRNPGGNGVEPDHRASPLIVVTAHTMTHRHARAVRCRTSSPSRT